MLNSIKMKGFNTAAVKWSLGIILVVAVLYHIEKLNCIVIVGDEFGYWANAAYLLGIDWSSVGGLNTYYSFGYSILLAPILFFCKSSVVAYKIAIVLNSFFILGSYLLSIYNMNDFFKSVDKRTVYFAAFAVTLYPNLFYQSQNTQCECFLNFMFWIVITLLKKLLERTSFLTFALYNFALLILYFAHMRNIGVLVSGVFVEFCIVCRKRKKNFLYIFLVLVILGIIFLIGDNVKGCLIDGLYKANESVSLNDYSGQISKIRQLFHDGGLTAFFNSFLGKLYYFGAASFLIGYSGLAGMIHLLYKEVKAKDRFSNKFFLVLFLLLSFLSQIVINSIYMLNSGERFDVLIYGRYMEHTFGPLLMFGILLQLREKNKLENYKINMVIITVFCIISLMVCQIALRMNITAYYPNNAVGLVKAGILTNTLYKGELIVNAAGFSVFLFFLLCFFSKRKNNLVQIAAILLIAGVWYKNAMVVVENHTFKNQDKMQNVISAAEIMKEDTIPVYFINEKVNSFTYIDYMQFLLKDKKIEVIEENQLNTIKEMAYIITYKDTPLNNDLKLLKYKGYESDYMDVFLLNSNTK